MTTPYVEWFACAQNHCFAILANESTINRAIKCAICGTTTVRVVAPPAESREGTR